MALSNTSDYWVQVGNALAQFDGVVAGYSQFCSDSPGYIPLTATQMLFMQMDGDLGDLSNAFGGEFQSRRSPGAAAAATAAHAKSTNRTWGSRCSMLAKVTFITISDQDKICDVFCYKSTASLQPHVDNNSQIDKSDHR